MVLILNRLVEHRCVHNRWRNLYIENLLHGNHCDHERCMWFTQHSWNFYWWSFSYAAVAIHAEEYGTQYFALHFTYLQLMKVWRYVLWLFLIGVIFWVLFTASVFEVFFFLIQGWLTFEYCVLMPTCPVLYRFCESCLVRNASCKWSYVPVKGFLSLHTFLIGRGRK